MQGWMRKKRFLLCISCRETISKDHLLFPITTLIFMAVRAEVIVGSLSGILQRLLYNIRSLESVS